MTMLHVETIGSGSPALVLLHGLGVNGAVWQPLVAALRDWPGRIVVPDFRGHGRSPHVRPYGVGQHAADIAALFAQGERVHIVGHSMGGQVGLMLASGWILARAVNHDWRGALLTLLTVVLVLRTSWNPLWLIAAGALAGMSGLV